MVLGDPTQSMPDRVDLRIDTTSINKPQLFTLSAKNNSALPELARRYINLLKQSDRKLENICFTANTQRSHFNHRLSCVANSVEDLSKQLTAYLNNQEIAGLHYGSELRSPQSITFMFTGQGSQYVGMGEQLYQTQPVFKKTLDRCADILDAYLDVPLLAVVFDHDNDRRGDSTSPLTSPSPLSPLLQGERIKGRGLIDQTQYTQPAIFALEYALAQLWISWGIKPDYLIGHSIGEYVAAAIAEVFSLEDALKLVATRGKLMQNLPKGGGMLAVFSDLETVKQLIANYPDDVAIAVINSPQNIVISGSLQVLEQITSKLDKQEIKTTPLKVSHAFHSSLMQPILAEFRAIAETITYNSPQILFISNLTGQVETELLTTCLLYTSPSPRDRTRSRMPSSA